MDNKKSVLAKKIVEEIASIKGEETKAKLIIAGLLYRMKESGLYKYLGTHIERWADFCIEINFQTRTADYYVAVFNKFVIELKTPTDKMEGAEMSNLRECVKYVNKVNLEEMLEQAKILTHRKLVGWLKTRNKSLTELAECKHTWTYFIMRKCDLCDAFEKIKTDDKSLKERFEKNGKPHVRNVEIDEIIEYLQKKRDIKQLDGSVKNNRQYALLCLNRVGKDLNRLKGVIQVAIDDKFHYKNATSMRYIFNNLARFETELKVPDNLNKLAEMKKSIGKQLSNKSRTETDEESAMEMRKLKR